MKKLFVILSLAMAFCFTFSCQDKAALAELEAMKAQAAVEEENKALVLQWFEGMAEKDFDKAFEPFSADYHLNFPSSTATPLTKEQNYELAKTMHQTFPDIINNIKDIIAVGDKVIVRALDTATHTQEFQGIPPTGNKFEVSWIIIFQIKDGKIVEAWEEVDWIGFMQQLGMELRPKEEK
jgi:steroid delta-isomerase-like uncharacterized protein